MVASTAEHSVDTELTQPELKGSRASAIEAQLSLPGMVFGTGVQLLLGKLALWCNEASHKLGRLEYLSSDLSYFSLSSLLMCFGKQNDSSRA